MSIIDSGKYRLRKDWASASIPSLVNIDEHDGDSGSGDTEGSLNVTAPLPPQKPPPAQLPGPRTVLQQVGQEPEAPQLDSRLLPAAR